MIKNYFKIAWRNLIANKGYSAINIGGLSVGMAVAILIGLWIYTELSFNKNFENYNRIAQVWQNQEYNGIVGSQVAGLIGINVSSIKSENSKDHDGYLMHIPIGIQYNIKKWKYNPYLKASYSIISAYNSEYSELTDSWDWGSSTIGGDYVGSSILLAIGYNWKFSNWFGIGVEIGYATSTYKGLKFLEETYELPSTLKGTEIYFRIPVIFLGP